MNSNRLVSMNAMTRCVPVVLGVLLGWLAMPSPQDPVKPPAPTPVAAPEATPLKEPAPVDLLGKPKPHPLEGVYSLRERILDGKTTPVPSRGFLCITNRHLFLTLAAPGSSADKVLLRSGARTWLPKDDNQVQTTVLLGWAADDDGKIQFEQPGLQEQRRIEPIRGGVRVTQDPRNWLDFERIE